MSETPLSFDYESKREKIRNFLALSVRERLNWLEETRKFLDKVSSARQKSLREKLRGEEL